MPYIYIGRPSPFAGKHLFKLLCNLKNHGQNRIVYCAQDQVQYPDKPTFFRILLAQPEMDEETVKGRVVAERVVNGVRDKHPVNISDLVDQEDFRLVPKSQEESFCRWAEIRDYDVELDAVEKPKYFEMPAFMQEVMKKTKGADADLRLPAYKTYQGNVRVIDKVDTTKMRDLIRDKFATYKDFDMDKIPFEEWKERRISAAVGTKVYLSYTEGKGWEELKEREGFLQD